MTSTKRTLRTREPWWWRPLGWLAALIGLAFWVAVIAVAWHFIGKYW